MHITAYSFITALVWFALFSLFISLLRKNVNFIRHLYVHSLLLLVVMTLIRVIFSVDSRHSHVIVSEKWLPAIIRAMTFPLVYIRETPISPLFCLLVIWCLGIVVNIVLLLEKTIGTMKRNAGMKSQMSPELSALIASMPGFPSHVKVIQHEVVGSAIMSGRWRPVLFLPVIELDAEEWRSIIEHELMHLRQNDFFTKTLVSFFRIIFWWYIPIRLIAEEADHILEIKCDDAVLKNASIEAVDYYSSALTKIAWSLLADENGESTAGKLWFQRKGKAENEMLLQRCELIQHYREPTKSCALTAGLLVIGLVLFVLSYSVILQPVFAPEIDSENDFQIVEGEMTLVELPDGRFELYIDGIFVALVENQENVRYGDLFKREDGMIP